VKLRNDLLSPQKEERHEPRHSPERTFGAADDFGGVAQSIEQMDGSTSFAAPDERRLPKNRHYENHAEWEARRSGVAPVSKKAAARRRRLTAADFDRRFA
jgi:hypothetical protein